MVLQYFSFLFSTHKQKGDIVYITSYSSEDGRWECVCNGLKGRVKMVYLDVLNKADIKRLQKQMRPPSLSLAGGWETLLKLSNLKELLQRIGCEVSVVICRGSYN